MVHIIIRSLIAFAAVFADGVSGLRSEDPMDLVAPAQQEEEPRRISKRHREDATVPVEVKRPCRPPLLLRPLRIPDPEKLQAEKDEKRMRRGFRTPQAPRQSNQDLTWSVHVIMPLPSGMELEFESLRVDPYSTPRDLLTQMFPRGYRYGLCYEDRSSSPIDDHPISIDTAWFDLQDLKVPLEVYTEARSARLTLFARVSVG